MKKIIVILLGFLAISCGNNDSLQKYFVESSEKPNFTQIDISPSTIIDENVFEKESDRQLLKTVKKINILFYQVKDKAEYQSELDRVNRILNSDIYNELIRVHSRFGRANVKMEGNSNDVNELVVELSHANKGFLLIRIIGNHMSAESLYHLALLLEKDKKLHNKILDLLPFRG